MKRLGARKGYAKGINKTEMFLIRFLSNLLLDGNDSLKKREMHILADTVNESVFSLIMQNNKIKANDISERLKVSGSTVR